MCKKVKPGKLRGNTTPNELTTNPNDFTLQLIGGMKYSLADIIQLVLLDGATVKTAQDLEESFRMVMEKGIEMSLMGNNVSLEYIQMRASVSGVFDSSTESFTRPKHEVNPVITAGQAYLEAAHQTLVENMGPMQNNIIAQITNRSTGKVNQDITAGGDVLVYLAGTAVRDLGDDVVLHRPHVFYQRLVGSFQIGLSGSNDGVYLMLGTGKTFCAAVEYSTDGGTHLDVFQTDVVAHQGHFDTFFHHHSEALFKVLGCLYGCTVQKYQLDDVGK